jgi:hypothetical protein
MYDDDIAYGLSACCASSQVCTYIEQSQKIHFDLGKFSYLSLIGVSILEVIMEEHNLDSSFHILRRWDSLVHNCKLELLLRMMRNANENADLVIVNDGSVCTSIR